ncbi:12710_t:CDS:10 [Funneliformis geosporum]|uniref:6705_t:CDS:1 n=1 Tax=Funneliformis geosporum TaxID=1117311 RepID=A0A9W4SG44_9GLOM|nr:12710_t:CDS:10 [Funneliformis geosporum]CAI2168205.1 6705_t:CDS:10 [Funneliformis geosporum]
MASNDNDMSTMVKCPVCDQTVDISEVNEHIDSGCKLPANPGVESTKHSTKNTPTKKITLMAKNDFFAPKSVKRRNRDDIEQTSLSSTSQSIQSPFSINQEKNNVAQSATLSSSRPSKQIKTINTKVDVVPLAARVRPNNLEDFIGQNELIGENGFLKSLILHDKIPSMIMWGPSGVGKTTLAKIIAKITQSTCKEFSGITHATADIRKAFDEAKNEQKLSGRRTIIILDEIHRFNKAQQDLFLPYVESGGVTLIGATTENPSFKINSALLSRCKVVVLSKLTTDEVLTILKRALNEIRKQRHQSKQTETSDETLLSENDDNQVNEEALRYLAVMSDGDARVALNALEIAINIKPEILKKNITKEDIKCVFQKTHLNYDKDGEEHYNIISALHKSMRGSDANASLYWLGRMLIGGEDPLFIARRLVVFASEDVGLADNSALPLAMATYQACQFIGMPECEINLAHCVTYLSEAKKSVRSYKAYGLVKKTIQEEYNYPVPHHLRNAPSGLMKEFGYNYGYKYNPDYEGTVHQEYLPKELKSKVFLDIYKATKVDDGRIELKDQVRHNEKVEIDEENIDFDFHYPFNESSRKNKFDITDNQ